MVRKSTATLVHACTQGAASSKRPTMDSTCAASEASAGKRPKTSKRLNSSVAYTLSAAYTAPRRVLPREYDSRAAWTSSSSSTSTEPAAVARPKAAMAKVAGSAPGPSGCGGSHTHDTRRAVLKAWLSPSRSHGSVTQRPWRMSLRSVTRRCCRARSRHCQNPPGRAATLGPALALFPPPFSVTREELPLFRGAPTAGGCRTGTAPALSPGGGESSDSNKCRSVPSAEGARMSTTSTTGWSRHASAKAPTAWSHCSH
mmetsp:Transcript_9299/g.27608  ORF Transcript_9299/g.27608 Transcript_9299/m.27608 type:complete len:257 (-) Transcript_9299:1309-2079(-)